jgi:VanZ family protein
MRKFLWRYGPAIAWVILLFGLSSIPDLSPPLKIWKWEDKIDHTLAYLPLGWFLMRAFAWNGRNMRKAFWLTLMIGTLYGISDEIHQYFVPGRDMNWLDAVADTIGIALGGWLYERWQKRKQPPKEKSASKMKTTVSAAK